MIRQQPDDGFRPRAGYVQAANRYCRQVLEINMRTAFSYKWPEIIGIHIMAIGPLRDVIGGMRFLRAAMRVAVLVGDRCVARLTTVATRRRDQRSPRKYPGHKHRGR
jgi:hypothetical protein